MKSDVISPGFFAALRDTRLLPLTSAFISVNPRPMSFAFRLLTNNLVFSAFSASPCPRRFLYGEWLNSYILFLPFAFFAALRDTRLSSFLCFCRQCYVLGVFCPGKSVKFPACRQTGCLMTFVYSPILRTYLLRTNKAGSLRICLAKQPHSFIISVTRKHACTTSLNIDYSKFFPCF